MTGHPELAIFFACATALVVGLYVTLDGFDLGVGILFPFAPRTADRNVMIKSLAPMWDGNETWLVLGGMVLLAGFPAAFAILLPAFYVPLALMLFGLVLRGIAFEFRSQRGAFELAWSLAFSGGAALAAFCQGTILGAFVSGRIEVTAGHFSGGPFGWLSAFSVATGLGVVAGYAALGAGWLVWRTSDETQAFARRAAKPALLMTAAALALVSVWTPLSLPSVAQKWFTPSSMLSLAPLPIVASFAWVVAWRSLSAHREWISFAASVVLFQASLAGIGASIWPAAIPGSMTIWEAGSAYRTQVIVATALIVVVPVILAYVCYSYWIFRGKVDDGEPA